MSAVAPVTGAVAVAEAIVSHEPTTEVGMVARANELHRAGIVQQCMELFRIVAQLKRDVLRERSTTWKEFVEKNFTFSLATADNYARIGRGEATVLTALGAVRHLHQSGRPGHKATKKTISKEEMATASEAEAIEKPVRELRIIESGSPLMSGAPSSSRKLDGEVVTRSVPENTKNTDAALPAVAIQSTDHEDAKDAARITAAIGCLLRLADLIEGRNGLDPALAARALFLEYGRDDPRYESCWLHAEVARDWLALFLDALREATP